MWQDLRYATRLLWKSPGFTLAATLTITLGIGANSAIFSVLDPLLIRKLPVSEPDRLVLVHSRGSLGAIQISERAAFDAYRENKTVFSGVLAFAPLNAAEISRNGSSRRVTSDAVSADYFRVLGIQPRLGTLLPATGSVRSVVLSFACWQKEFRADPEIIGQPLRLNGQLYTVSGVAPSGFFGLEVGRAPELFIPLNSVNPAVDWLMIVARLSPALSAHQAETILEPIFGRLANQSAVPAIERQQFLAHVEVTDASRGLSAIRERYALASRILAIIVLLVLLIACANVSSLQVVRNIDRVREFTIRRALGANLGRLVRQSLTESSVVAAVGVMIGTLLGLLMSRALVSWLATEGSPLVLAQVSAGHLILFAIIALAIAALLCGLPPVISLLAAEHRGDLELRSAYLGRSRPRSFLTRSLVAAQLALSIAVVVNTALLIRTLVNLQRSNLGFDQNGVIAISIDSSSPEQRTPERMTNLRNHLLDRLEAIPGVQSAALSAYTPMSGRELGININIDGQPRRASRDTHVYLNAVTPRYFHTLGIPIFHGRDFARADAIHQTGVAVINQHLARRFFGEKDPIGAKLRFVEGHRPPLEIIGVVGDSRYNNLREEPVSLVYVPMQQIAGTFSLRVNGIGKDALAAAVPQVIDSVDSSLRVTRINTYQEQIDQTLHQDRLISQLCTILSALALVLTAVGVYGVLSFGVVRRTSEIGLRLALGASRGGVVQLMLRETIWLLAWGLVMGIPLTIAAANLFSATFFGVSTTDPASLAAALATLLLCVLLAGYLPARRASRVDPIAALRHE